MEAPDKIYVYIPDDDIVGTASKQIGFPHQFVTEEYIRTDAFIDKAEKWLHGFMECSPLFEYQVSESEQKETIEDFRNYMKGE